MRAWIFGAAALFGFAASGLAADVAAPVAKAPPPGAKPWTWTGCSIGGHVGGLSASHTDWTVRTSGGDFYGQSLGGHDASSWLAGVQGGCDHQFAGGLVLGIGGDYTWTDAVGRNASTRETGVFYHSTVSSLASVTGRAGYAWSGLLGYVRGGAAWQRDRYSASTIVIGTAYTAEVTRTGWTVGVGGEYALSPMLSAFLEYNYYDFGNSRIGLTPQYPDLRPASVDIKAATSAVRAGINVRFGPGAMP